jgi:hypothetical protein
MFEPICELETVGGVVVSGSLDLLEVESMAVNN